MRLGYVASLLSLASVAIGQIGVDKVDQTVTEHIIEVDTKYLTQDPASYAGKIGVNTDMLTEDNGVTKWIGVNSEYITQITTTTTNAQGTPVTSTTDVQASIVGDLPADGILKADISVLISPSFVDEINGIRTEFCSLKKRALACRPGFLTKVTAAFDIYAAAEAGKYAGFGGIGVVGAMFAAQMQKIAEGGKETPFKVDIKKDDFNKAKPIQTIITTIIITKPGTSTTSPTSKLQSTAEGGKPPSTGPTGVAECWLYRGSKPDLSDVETDDNNTGEDLPDTSTPNKVKRVAGRVAYDNSVILLRSPVIDDSLQSRNPASILKRGKPLSKLGNCPQVLSPELRTALRYPSVSDIQKTTAAGLPGDQWWYIPQPAAGLKLCTVYTLQHKGNTGTGTGVGTLPAGYDQQNPAAKKLSVDHAYEVSFIKDFFSSVFTDSKDVRCKPFIDMFTKDNANPAAVDDSGKRLSRLQTLFFLGPNKKNKAFIGLDQNINAVKGKLMNPGLDGIQKIKVPGPSLTPLDAVDANLNLWNDIAMAWSFNKLPAAQVQFKKINTAVYRGFLAFDDLQACEPIKGAGDSLFPATWASQYEAYIRNFLKKQQADTVKYVASITSAIEALPSATENPDKTKNKFGHAFEALTKEFPEEFYNLDEKALFDFSGDALQIKRDNAVIGFPACSTTKAPTPTDFPTLSKTCVTSTVFDCKWIYRQVTNIADCPTTTVNTLPASCTVKPTFTPPKPPAYTGGARPEFTWQCINKNMAGIKPVDRRIASDAINLGCGSEMIETPPGNWDGSQIGWEDGIRTKSSQYLHMTHHWSDNQDGCKPKPKSLSGIPYKDCQHAQLLIIDNCNTDTVTEKYGGAGRWNSPIGCIDFEIWSPDPAPK
ncbi:uncharacterized protein BP5553_07457 [Venustampulla echinocandica]|uniref:Uncharacterized protein n=1 Tax=Venustampulla echinocandica TaxID=2656787 RepID=A0A370TGK5_9HELO|nr:uncharacterized protein BP5553_07457 [Venustampulla echinocandica]RDL34329.1 hypothetical protein BP5553_07457 [Venustampulla echinocandica]